MVGQAAFSLGLAALVLGLRRALPPSDHRMVGCGLLALASIGTMACAVARNSCEESVPRCEGNTFTTVSDWVHGIGSLAEIIGVAGAALVLAAALPRHWSAYSAATGGATFAWLLVWQAVPYPWVGTAERVLALALVGWAAAMGTRLTAHDEGSGRLVSAQLQEVRTQRVTTRHLTRPGGPSRSLRSGRRLAAW